LLRSSDSAWGLEISSGFDCSSSALTKFEISPLAAELFERIEEFLFEREWEAEQ